MSSHLWFFWALGASVFWGVNYATTEKLLHNNFSVYFMMFASSCLFMTVSVIAGIKNNVFKSSMQALQTGQVSPVIFGLYVFSALLGWYAVNTAISLKNSTSVGLVELSYPLSTIFFTWLFFNVIHLNPMTFVALLLFIAGGVLVILYG